MGYRIKTYKLKDGSPAFKILFEHFTGGLRQNKGVPREEWRQLGFSSEMTADEAKARARELNAKEKLERDGRKRTAIRQRLQTEELAQLAYLPAVAIQEFEQTKLFRQFRANDKITSYWRRTKAILCELKLDPETWLDHKERFYDYFSQNQYSPSYVRQLIYLLNQWGRFISRRQRKPFDPIPSPRGRERERIADSYFERPSGRGNKASAPLTPTMLESKKSELKSEHYNWLYLSVWFGLRPEEVDGLKNATLFRLTEEGKTPVLMVYQSKLKAIDRCKRWKPIPCFLPEQLRGLEIIRSKEFRRPLSKTVAAKFGPDVTLYGGRKGFIDLMLDKGQSLEDVSTWMGHTSIERTWKSYKNKQKVRFKPLAS